MIGINCRYNGTSTSDKSLIKLIEDGKAIYACPEELAGLPTPRESCEIIQKSRTIKVRSKSGLDFTQDFKKAALETLKVCDQHKVTAAILQSRSPSCGFGSIYSGEFNGKLIEGNGLTAELLFKNNIKVYNETNWPNEK